MKKDLERRVNAISLADCGKDLGYVEFLEEVQLTGATMYITNCGGLCTASFIVYEDGTLFHQSDWQGGHPETAEEIADFDWLTEDGRPAIILDGLPRLFA